MIKLFKEAKNFKDLVKKDPNILLLNQNALDLKNIPSNSIDYIFTDPPYGGKVQYFELSTLWCAWLNKKGDFSLDYNGEVTINKNQQKEFDFYHNMLRTAFSEMYRVLKGGKYLTVTFHNTTIKIYNSIHRASVLSGFDLEKVIYQPPARPSAKQLLQPYGSARGDYYIRFKKPENVRGKLPDETEIDKERYERIVIGCVRKVIAERGEPTPYSYIINSYAGIYDEIRKNGYLFSASEDIEKILKKHSEIFVKIPKTDSNGKKVGYLWWFRDPSSIPFLEKVPLSDRVEKIVLDVLYKNYQVTFDDVLQEVFKKFPNSLTPETLDVYNALEEYTEQIAGGKWRLKPKVQERVEEHDKLVEYICELGEKAGYEVYGDIPKRRRRLKFNLPPSNLERIHEIDVLWYKSDFICYAFEVEHTTSIMSAIVRGSNITASVKRIILIPEERENVLFKRLREPILEERIKADKWMFIRYDDFYRFYNKNNKNKKIDPAELEKLNKMPVYTRVDPLERYIGSYE